MSLPDRNEEQQTIPVAWRPTLCRIAEELAAGNYCLEPGIPSVSPVPASTASQIREYVQAYGAKLIPLSAATWESSACTWAGDHWDAIVDLWTEEEGRSDMVLHALVFPAGATFRVEVHAVYVP